MKAKYLVLFSVSTALILGFFAKVINYQLEAMDLTSDLREAVKEADIHRRSADSMWDAKQNHIIAQNNAIRYSLDSVLFDQSIKHLLNHSEIK